MGSLGRWRSTQTGQRQWWRFLCQWGHTGRWWSCPLSGRCTGPASTSPILPLPAGWLLLSKHEGGRDRRERGKAVSRTEAEKWCLSLRLTQRNNRRVLAAWWRGEGGSVTRGERNKTQIDRRYDGEPLLYASACSHVRAPPPPSPPSKKPPTKQKSAHPPTQICVRGAFDLRRDASLLLRPS